MLFIAGAYRAEAKTWGEPNSLFPAPALGCEDAEDCTCQGNPTSEVSFSSADLSACKAKKEQGLITTTNPKSDGIRSYCYCTCTCANGPKYYRHIFKQNSARRERKSEVEGGKARPVYGKASDAHKEDQYADVVIENSNDFLDE